MALIGSLIALGAAIVFAVVAIATLWGGWQAIQRELLRGFVSTNPSIGERIWSILLTVLPLIGATLLGLLAAWRIAQVAFGLG
ncbi:MAG: hypothetical protein KatS3mg055_3660 [Chloroflexus sp.]|jgi:TRAP-type C4-dicarboxylate transport system permease small subunit|uniref:hypothetical protein n=1 Tax=Chloroflexus sp. TaxID=1904827 RepID=UPI0021DD90EC|nr:hypothetical protein [Chloroflexus sp.]GIV91142.1 MAG: hypothetical protein KatS3mg055_3660 [Chloroflexus sp.]